MSVSNVMSKSLNKKKPLKKLSAKEGIVEENTSAIENDGVVHQLAGLHCTQYGGPLDGSAAEMVYWSDIKDDAKVISPFHDKNKYLTFEPDHGGWNNIRMAMETGKFKCP